LNGLAALDADPEEVNSRRAVNTAQTGVSGREYIQANQLSQQSSNPAAVTLRAEMNTSPPSKPNPSALKDAPRLLAI